MKSKKILGLNYRPEIDGLRAIAIISVILYHAKIVFFDRYWFDGGYIGVDIFFVISGYLITRIILFEIYEKGGCDFKAFYFKRAKRILPMLFFIIIVSLPFAYNILMPSNFIEYLKSILSSVFFGSNFFFYFIATTYGAESSLLKPFLHTWSLGIEEQFYIIFPLFLVLIVKRFNKYFIVFVTLLLLGSLYFSEEMSIKNPDLNFYFPLSRFWELLTGAVLAYRELKYKNYTNPLLKLLPLIGFLILIGSFYYFNSDTQHPSYYTVIPLIGVSLIIAFSSNDDLIGGVLGSKPFVWVGLISYSAYLWHFPIFSFSRIYNAELSNSNKIDLILIVFILSILTYFIIERPFRRGFIKDSFFLKLSAIIVVVIVIVIVSLYLINRFDYKKIEDVARTNSNAILDKGAFLEVFRDKAIEDAPATNFDNSEKRKVLIVGNSHGIDLFRILNSAKLYSEIDFALITQNRNTDNYQVSCFYRYVTVGYKGCGNRGVTFNDLDDKMNRSDLIVLGTRWTDQDILILDYLIKILKSKYGKDVIVIGNSFEQKDNPIEIRKFIINNRRMPTNSELIEIEKNIFLGGKSKVDAKLIEISSRNDVDFLRKDDLFCDFFKKRCPVFTDDGYLILWDYGHMTVHGSRYAGKLVDEKEWGKKLFLGISNK